MPIVPMKQIIQVERGSQLDDWGKPILEEPIEYFCRVDEGSFLVQTKSAGSITSKEVVAEARILLDGLVGIHYDDLISYTNELKQGLKMPPKKIEVKRMFNGKPIMTVVYI